MAGTEVKINISVEPMGDIHMENYDFECIFYPYVSGRENMKKGMRFTKSQMSQVDADNYMAVVDTTSLGPCDIMCRLTAWIPDGDCEDGLRTEIVTFPTGITMY